MRVYIIGGFFQSYIWTIICLFLLIFSFLFASFLSLYSLCLFSSNFVLIIRFVLVFHLFLPNIHFVRVGLYFYVLLM